MSGHTPGPWTYVPGTGTVTAHDGRCVTVPSARLKAMGDLNRADAEIDANGRLIATAPELLKLASRVDYLFTRGNPTHDELIGVYESARTLLAKVKL